MSGFIFLYIMPKKREKFYHLEDLKYEDFKTQENLTNNSYKNKMNIRYKLCHKYKG